MCVSHTAETLLKVVKDRVQILMKQYNDEKTLDELTEAGKVYHKDIVQDLTEEIRAITEDSGDAPLMLATVTDDPNVPNRTFIKAASKRIVLANAKKED